MLNPLQLEALEYTAQGKATMLIILAAFWKNAPGQTVAEAIDLAFSSRPNFYAARQHLVEILSCSAQDKKKLISVYNKLKHFYDSTGVVSKVIERGNLAVEAWGLWLFKDPFYCANVRATPQRLFPL